MLRGWLRRVGLGLIHHLAYAYVYLLATFHLDDGAVCAMSVGRGLHNDFHDYCDDPLGEPMHFVTMTCVRCGKDFTM